MGLSIYENKVDFGLFSVPPVNKKPPLSDVLPRPHSVLDPTESSGTLDLPRVHSTWVKERVLDLVSSVLVCPATEDPLVSTPQGPIHTRVWEYSYRSYHDLPWSPGTYV